MTGGEAREGMGLRPIRIWSLCLGLWLLALFGAFSAMGALEGFAQGVPRSALCLDRRTCCPRRADGRAETAQGGRLGFSSFEVKVMVV